MPNPHAPRIRVRPFEDRRDAEGMVDYFLGADPEYLRGMGVDLPDGPEE